MALNINNGRIGLKRKRRLGEILVEDNAITQEQLDEAFESQKTTHQGKKLGEILVEMEYLTEEQMAETLERQLGYEVVQLSALRIPEEILKLVDEAILRKYMLMPFGISDKNPNILKVAMNDPLNIRAIDDITMITAMQVEIYVATPTEINFAINRYFGNAAAQKAAAEFAREREQQAKAAKAAAAKTEKADEADDEVSQAPIVKLVRQIIEQGVRRRASDIHIEPMETYVRVRYRIDGVLHEIMKHDISIHPALSARVKIISDLDISEKRKPQDGRATAIVDKQEYDIRVSLLPTVYGEKIVMRLTEKKALSREKKMLGFRPDELIKFDKILNHPNGIILVTGPTGSGKSTTLYTALSELNVEGVNIITVEDPVEANIEGVNQVQTNEKAGLTFAAALRSILRQDPDIIMIGEIRDQETAEIAVKASITGHLVVSTLHTNSSASTITRLADMGVENYMIADSVVGVIAQRLVRRVCPECGQYHEATDSEMRFMGFDSSAPKIQIKSAAHKDDCVTCGGSGYRGRIGVYEIMPVTNSLKRVIAAGENADKIEQTALKEGMKTLRQSAIQDVIDGITTIDEVKRITFSDEDEDDLE